MFRASFSFEGVSGIVRRNRFATNLNHALYYKALLDAYPERAALVPGLLGKPVEQATQDEIVVLTWLPTANSFARVASHIETIQGAAFDTFSIEPGLAKAACAWLVEHDQLFEAILAAVDSLYKPNGVDGAPLEALTKGEAKDPLSLPPVESGDAPG